MKQHAIKTSTKNYPQTHIYPHKITVRFACPKKKIEKKKKINKKISSIKANFALLLLSTKYFAIYNPNTSLYFIIQESDATLPVLFNEIVFS